MFKIIKYIIIIAGIIGLIYYFGSPKTRKWLINQDKTITEKLEMKIEDGKGKLKDKFDKNKGQIQDKLNEAKENVKEKIDKVIKK
ncbi:MAG: hypothetical protein HY934_00180 [Candidatus Firestonebacteria bacterium]|nr:hypothetical protein [Candidatus Firestonebacteria bacterium]